MNVKEEAIAQADFKAWSDEVLDFGRSSSNLMADLYMSHRRSELSNAAAANWATTGPEALLEQADEVDESSAGKDNSFPNLSSVTALLPSLPKEPSTKDMEAAIEGAPERIKEAVVAAPPAIAGVAAKVYAYQWTFLDIYLCSMFLIGICLLPCVLPLLRHIKVKTWRDTWCYKILPLVLIMLLVPLQLVVFEKLGFLSKTVELAEPFVVFSVVAVSVLVPVGCMFYEIAHQKLQPFLKRFAQLEQRLEAITGVDLDGDGEVAQLWGKTPEWLKGLQGQKERPGSDQAGVLSESADAGKKSPRKPSSASHPRSAKKGCLAAC